MFTRSSVTADLLLPIILGLGVMAAHASDSRRVGGELTSADTAIAVEAGEQAPRLTTLGLRRAMVWKNRTDEGLPDQVEVHGAAQPWRWRARGGYGPIEHTLLIQNLSNETVWLPLQPSFRFEGRRFQLDRRPLSNRRAFYDARHVLPPAMLEGYVAEWPTARIENFRYLLRSGMLGWFSLMLDTSRWSPRQRADARVQFALYQSALRPLIRAADLYHVSQRPDGVQWDGIEYYSARLGRGVLYAFRGSAPDQPAHRFRLRGLTPRSRYALKFQDQGAAADRVQTGEVLMQQGVAVTLKWPLSSELLFFEKVHSGDSPPGVTARTAGMWHRGIDGAHSDAKARPMKALRGGEPRCKFATKLVNANHSN